ncbi:MAG: four helix bundle protein [Calditrichaeota bacterium]|nr:four helix bundle protein [Calditrichota bacterium]
MGESIKHFRDLRVYNQAFETAPIIFSATKTFPKEEKYAIVDQMRRSSRSICANLAELWRKRRYKAAFISKLSDCEAEACEMQVWLEFAFRSGYSEAAFYQKYDKAYQQILAQLVKMSRQPEKWTIG